jgi:hypothetical protein
MSTTGFLAPAKKVNVDENGANSFIRLILYYFEPDFLPIFGMATS